MKRIGVTQRTDHIESYNEARDCLDQRFADLLLPLNFLCVPLPNLPPLKASVLLDSLGLSGVIFSGGNTLSGLEPAAIDANIRRDQFETELLTQCIERKVPTLGLCRGMQLMNFSLGGTLTPVENHVASRHELFGDSSWRFPSEVNSYHKWGIPAEGLSDHLMPLATDEDGNIEACSHRTAPMVGIMWHPEREPETSSKDIDLIKSLFG